MSSGADTLTNDASDSAWLYSGGHGLRIADAMDEIKNFAFKAFESLDFNGDGFVSREELTSALVSSGYDWRERSFISFLLRRIDDIKDAYAEEWTSENDGISRMDIQEYFKDLKNRV